MWKFTPETLVSAKVKVECRYMKPCYTTSRKIRKLNAACAHADA
jgi:hypothetical protein